MIERVVINLPATPGAKPQMVRLKLPPDQHRSSLCDNITCRGGWADVQWGADSKTLAFVSTSRDHKQEWMRIANPTPAMSARSWENSPKPSTRAATAP